MTYVQGNDKVNVVKSFAQKKKHCWILYIEKLSHAWFLKLTVSNNTSIKISTTIKCWPRQQRNQQKFAELMPPLFFRRSTTICRSIFFLIRRATKITVSPSLTGNQLWTIFFIDVNCSVSVRYPSNNSISVWFSWGETFCLTLLQATIPQNGPTHSNNSSSTCLWPFCWADG